MAYEKDKENVETAFKHKEVICMPDTIDRKIYFYRIELKKNGQTVSLEPIFSTINQMPFDKNGRYLQLSDGNMWSICIDSINSPLKVRIGTIRKKGLPMMERHGQTSPLTIPPDAGLYEPMHFIVFPNNVVGFEYNFYGPRPGSLKYYLPKKLPNLVDEVELVPLTRRDVHDLLSRIGEVRVFRLKIHRDMGELLKELDDNLPDAIEAAKHASDAEYIEIVFRSKKYSRHGINIPFLNRLASWLSRSEVRAAVDTLKIRARDEITQSVEEFDLLQEYLLSVKQVLKQDDIHRSVNTNAMYSAIQEAYNELSPEINRIINEGNRNE